LLSAPYTHHASQREDRGELKQLPCIVQAVTQDSIGIVWVDQGCTSAWTATNAAKHGIALEAVKSPKAKRGLTASATRHSTTEDDVRDMTMSEAARLRTLEE